VPQTIKLIDNLPTCKPKVSENFELEGAQLDWNNWTASKVFNNQGGNITLVSNDWLESTYLYQGNNNTIIDLGGFTSNGAWAAITFNLVYTDGNKTSVTLLKEAWGYTLVIKKSGEDRKLYLGTDLSLFNPLELHMQNNTLFIGGKIADKAALTNFYITGLPNTSYKFSMIVNGEGSSTVEGELSSFKINSCE